jgi:hypothetical protein
LEWTLFAICGLMPVVTGCCRVSGIVFSTDLAQPPEHCAAAADARCGCSAAPHASPPFCGMAIVPVALRRRAIIVIYGRYSTQEQDVSSIDDQFAFCEAVIQQLGFTDFEVIKISDMELSGELASRPGIDKVREGIEKGSWDLLICEDSSPYGQNIEPRTECGERRWSGAVRLRNLGRARVFQSAERRAGRDGFDVGEVL